MSIKEFELFHGAILNKLVRNEKPITLRLIETRFDDSRVYTINDVVELYVKHSISPRKLTRGEGGYSWTFSFNTEHLNQIRELKKKKPTYLVLVCAHRDVKEARTESCLINLSEHPDLLSLEVGDQQSITVKWTPGAKKLRIFQDRQEKFLLPLNALDNWDIPQS
jgi:hypothetical protein